MLPRRERSRLCIIAPTLWKEHAVAEQSRQVPPELFDKLWNDPFRHVAKDANETDSYTARRFILESRLAEATVSMVIWTKLGLLVSLLTSAASLAIALLRP
jgi:hypothetical protein